MRVNCGASRAANLGGRGPCLASWAALQVVGYKEDNVDHFHQTSPRGVFIRQEGFPMVVQQGFELQHL